MSKTGNNPDGQDDVDAIFDELVAGLRAEGVGTRAEAAEAADAPRAQRREEDEPPARQPSDWRSGEVGWDETMLADSPADAADDDDDEHFVPPEPPPLPRPTRAMAIVALFFAVGLVLLIVPGVIGMGPVVATPLGILSLAAGLGFLLLRRRDDNRPPGSDPSTGAQV
ncbi:MAG: hypothetical protein ACRDQB_06610 [Thermocrispum sp.]